MKPFDVRKSIGTVSRELGVESHVLRFWEKEFPQLKVNTGKGGRRYYYNDDEDKIRKIKYLLYEAGYTIAGVKKLLSENKTLLKIPMEDLKNISKIMSKGNFDKNEVAKVFNDIMIMQTKLGDFMNKFKKFTF